MISFRLQGIRGMLDDASAQALARRRLSLRDFLTALPYGTVAVSCCGVVFVAGGVAVPIRGPRAGFIEGSGQHMSVIAPKAAGQNIA
jgi:hypothetical protein